MVGMMVLFSFHSYIFCMFTSCCLYFLWLLQIIHKFTRRYLEYNEKYSNFAACINFCILYP